MPNLRDTHPTVTLPVAHVEQLKTEIYTLGTSIRQVSGESGLSTDTVKSILNGNKVEQTTAARLDAYLKALARNAFHNTRATIKFPKGMMAGKAMRLNRAYYAINKELWKEYKLTTLHPDDFAKLPRREQYAELLKKERMAKAALMDRHKPFIDRFRVWLADGWTYWRWKSHLKVRMTP